MRGCLDRRKAVRFLCWGPSHRTGDVSHADGWAMHPPFSFRSCRKENGPCTVQKKRTPLVALRHLRASALYGGRREMVPAGLRGLTDGRGGVRYRLDGGFPRRGCGGWSGCKNAFDQLLFPRVPLCYALPWRSWGSVPAGGCGHPPLRQDYGFPRSRRGRCLHRPVAEAPSTTKPAAAKSGAGCIPDFPGPKVTPRATRFRL